MDKKISLLPVVLLFFTSFLNASQYDQKPLEDMYTERIISFISDIIINADSSILVTETITVIANGNEIKRGIYRDIPTSFTGPMGISLDAPINIKSIKRNGQTSPYHIEKKGGKDRTIRIYIGKEETFLSPGKHVYEIVYHSEGQLGFFESYDELYWNVTGNDWAFDIEFASCTVTLPGDATLKKIAAYTGPKGAKGSSFYINKNDPSKPQFETTDFLFPDYGFTIAVSWPKGFVTEPTQAQIIKMVIFSNLNILIGFFGLIIVLLYYLYTWNLVGKDPPMGTIVPLFHPPANLSPAAIRTVMNMGFDDKSFSAAIINMAVKCFITITETKKLGRKEFTLSRTALNEKQAGLTKGESAIALILFGNARNEIAMIPQHREFFQSANSRLKEMLNGEHEKVHFLKNWKYLVWGSALTLLVLIMMSVYSQDLPIALFMSIWLFFWSIGTFALITSITSIYKEGHIGKGCAMTVFALPFTLGLFTAAGIYAFFVSLPGAILIMLMLIINALFYQFMKAPTLKGRKLMDEIEGFKMFLSITEKDRLNLLHCPKVTPEIFERYLPYAIALNVENQWGKRFEQEMAFLGQDNSSYRPLWYSGTMFTTSGIGTFSQSLSTAFTTAAASSSGSSGSGSSGGGRGGGGGGGW